MTQFDVMYGVATEVITLDTGKRLLKNMKSDIVLSKRNMLTKDELLSNVVTDDPATCTGYCHMNHGVGDCEKMHIVNGKFDNDEDTGFTPDHMAIVIICSKDKEKVFKIDHDHIVEA